MRRTMYFCGAFALGCVLAQYLLASAYWLAACGIALAVAAIVAALLRADTRTRVLLCALGAALAFGWSSLYRVIVVAPNEALIGTTDGVEVELCSYAVETNYGAKATVRILGRGLHGKAIYYGDTSLLAMEPGEQVRDTVLFNSAVDPAGTGEFLRGFTAKGVYLLLYSRGEPQYESANAGSLRYLPQRTARMLGEKIASLYDEREGGFLRALLLGDKDHLDEEDSRIDELVTVIENEIAALKE